MLERGRGNIPKGVSHYKSKFTEDQIRDIRSDSRTQSAIAQEYNCCQATIGHIRNRKTWRHVE